MDINSILVIISVVFGLIIIILGGWIVRRFAGKLKNALIFLIVAVVLIVLEGILEITGIFTTTNSELIRNLVHLVVILFIWLTIINMKQMVDGIDNRYSKRIKYP